MTPAEAADSGRRDGPIVTIDVVVFRFVGAAIEVLVVTREREPFLGSPALPGAYVLSGERLTDACWRCLTTKAGLLRAVTAGEVGSPRQFLAADSVARDPRGPAVSIVHMATAAPTTEPHGGESPQWRSLDDIADLAFDHVEVVGAARRFLADRLWVDVDTYVRLAADRPMTTPFLRSIAEAATGTTLDHANFTRRLTGSGLFEVSEPTTAELTPSTPFANRRTRGRGRPATVWAPRHQPAGA